MYDRIRDSASDEIPLPDDWIVSRDIGLQEVPAIADDATNLLIDQVNAEELMISVPVQVERVEKLAVALEPKISAVVPPFRSGKQANHASSEAGDQQDQAGEISGRS